MDRIKLQAIYLIRSKLNNLTLKFEYDKKKVLFVLTEQKMKGAIIWHLIYWPGCVLSGAILSAMAIHFFDFDRGFWLGVVTTIPFAIPFAWNRKRIENYFNANKYERMMLKGY
jgi:hypothetical protein